MRKFKNTYFLQDLISSDFPIISTSGNQATSSNFFLNLKRSNKLGVVNLLHLHQNLKQFIRILKFVKHSSNKKITFWVEDLYILELFERFLINNRETLELRTSIPMFLSSNNLKLKDVSNFLSFLFILGKPYSKYNVNTVKFLLNNRFQLLTQLNTQRHSHLLGSYKIFNDLDDFKKVLFLSIVINNILTSVDNSLKR